ncbi:hypothetical protein PF010_g20732 [Phytophthora fragariae]|uniref:SGNH hydrolase-type esterase domain-containing protein n=1 Tax=Phytophthora fragariae TaxID=53985 RepID=A0A6G0KEA3_9STRA|nr:hypothetical protein PF010_g20732 [Phytophthora fragariae]
MAGEYAKACVVTAERLNVAVLDVHSLFNSMSARDQAMTLEDGLHLSAWGNRLMDRLLRAKIADAFPALACVTPACCGGPQLGSTQMIIV